MKKLLKIILTLGVAFVIMAFGARASGNESIEYIITPEGEDYLLSQYTGDGPTPVLRSSSFADLTEYISSISPAESSIVFGGVTVDESVNINGGSYTLSGSLTLTGDAVLNIDSKGTTLSQIALKMDNGYIRLKKGSLAVNKSTVESKRNSAVILNYSADASLFVKAESFILSESDKAAINVQLGSAYISGGEIKSLSGTGIVNRSTLSLSGSPSIDGREYGIVSNNPILLSIANEFYSGAISIKYEKDFPEGSISCVFYSASKNSLENIKLYDINGEKRIITFFDQAEGFSERNFGAVYLPYYVDYYVDQSLIKRVEALRGDLTNSISAPEKEGYEFVGWSLEYGENLLYDFALGIENSFDLHASYKLKPPSFSLSSLTFDYDGKEHPLRVNSIEHPLQESAIIGFTWYDEKNNVIGHGEEIKLKNVSESGKYSCKIDFTYGTDSLFVITPEIEVLINRASVEIPTVAEKYYNGEEQKPDIYSTSVYTVSNTVGRVVGNYSVEIRLKDPANYVFKSGSDVAFVEFKILKGENYWLDEPIIHDVYEGATPSPVSSSRFGEAIYLYSDNSEGPFSDSLPRKAGVYYCLAKVMPTDNYSELISSPIKFEIIEERLTGISILSMPNVCEYTAFQKFIADGLSLSVTYNSKRTEKITADRISFSYQSADSFRYGDTAVIASYLDLSIAVPVNVEKAEYDVSGITFKDATLTYDGAAKTIGYKGMLPVGLDGIPLECKIEGGGINAGDYTLVLTFSTRSKNYSLPRSMTAKLSILPYESKVYFLNYEFVYDGALKCPEAYYVDIYGRKITLEVSGARSHAGEYEAIALSNDKNYKLLESKTVYKIKKANYNFENISWSAADFVYDGKEKSVSVNGLPSGVSVIGYSDSSAVNAGNYIAKALLSYDEKNYNPPEELSYNWSIKKADYDLSGFSFLDVTTVYSGLPVYPKLLGEMPIGIDGSILEYRFDRGVQNVSEGRCAVSIVYSTKSKNYNVPESGIAYVEVIPCGITVEWSNFEFTYDTSSHVPSAVSNICGVSVIGGRVDAGKYTATAISLDSNYYVINQSVEFIINKAINAWVEFLKADDIFEGRIPSPKAKALAGEVIFEYYSDALCENKIDVPTLPGVYYAVAHTSGNDNYHSIKSSPVPFEIIKVIPIGITVSFVGENLSAFDVIGCRDISIIAEYNDGSLIPAVFEDVIVKYQSADSLRFGDSHITVSYLGFSKDVPLSVGKADYDMSGARWSDTEFIYDGEEKSIVITGLPHGVNVISYSGASAVTCGEYIAYAELSYDSYNFNAPSLPEGRFRIKKQTVKSPVIESFEYCGTEYLPSLEESELYTAVILPYVNAGKYYLELRLKDSANYEFTNSSSEILIEYEILPRKITVKLSDIDKYLLGKQSKPSFEVVDGIIAEGDTLTPKYIYEHGRVSCEFDNPNYSITVIEGKIIERNALSEDDLFKVFTGFLLFVLIILSVLIFVLRRKDIIHYVSLIRCRLSPVSKTEGATEENTCAERINPADVGNEEKPDENISEVEKTLSVDKERADSLITDSLARDLVRKDNVRIYTDGNKKRIINVDTLSENFPSGDCIDVNKLKQMSLIPYDTAYVKVLARGIIDKPLKVYANDFSLSAVKMIALTGGEAVKVITVRKKKNEGNESDNKIT